MKVTLWGTRGSLASPGPDTVRYGGNTSCVGVEGENATLLILDAGTGIRGLGQGLPPACREVHVLLTHLHMDHVQGLPFFSPLRSSEVKVHVWGPASTTHSLSARVLRYLSPPLFPVSIRDLSLDLEFHETTSSKFEVLGFKVTAQLVIHPNATVGYRIETADGILTYLPDHEPALGNHRFPGGSDWTSGYDLAEGADFLIHDAQYTEAEYRRNVGFGHSSIGQAYGFARLTGVRAFAPFHHDPSHSDDMLDAVYARANDAYEPDFLVMPAKEGMIFEIGG
ncbi:MAG: MBL fold metallo-hydrolase [Caldilineales bacterium]|nr:MBL fold metallo-hydrolase [Caldilineales bacterium]